MSKYIEIGGRYYYSPCSACVENSCYFCVLNKYKEDLKLETERRNSAEYRIETELEPRIKAEKYSYDMWVSQDTGAELCYCFSSKIDALIDFVKDNEAYMDWGDENGDLEQKILYMIKENIEEEK